MAPTTILGLTCFLLLALCASSVSSKPASNTATESAKALPQVAKRNAHLRDYRWRMLSAMSALNQYANTLQTRYSNKETIIRVNKEHPNHHLLTDILSSLCNLMAFYEMAAKMDPTANDTALLSEIVKDSCNWVKYLVTRGALIGSSDYPAEPTCSPTNVTPLHRYCYQVKASHLWYMTDIGVHRLHDYLSQYHQSDGLPATSWRDWLNTVTLTPQQKDRIAMNALLAVLQNIILSKL